MKLRVVLAWMLVVASACDGDDVSIGELRCVGTRCEASPRYSVFRAVHEAEQVSEAPASFVFRTTPPCLDEHRCWRGGLGPASFDVHDDGSVTVAAAYTPSSFDEDEATGVRGVVVMHVAADGAVLWQNTDFDGVPDPYASEPRVAMAKGDGAVFVAMSGLDEDKLRVVRLNLEDGQGETLFERSGATLPAALALVEGDLLIAGVDSNNPDTGNNPEVSRYRPSGELVWRQVALREGAPSSSSSALFISDMRLATDTLGNSLVTVPEFDHYSFVRLAADGVATWLQKGSDWPQGSLRAHVRFDREGRIVLGYDGLNSYSVDRCLIEMRASVMSVSRARETFRSPELLGLAVDADSRIHVLTQDGLRLEPRFLIDRYSSDLSHRETFIVAEGDARLDESLHEFAAVNDIAIGPDGDVYYLSPGGVGRIHLATP